MTRHDSAAWVVVAGKHARLRRGAVRRLRVRCAGTIVCPDAVLLPVHERQPVHRGLQQLQQRPLRLPQRLPDAVPDAREYLPVHRSGHTCTQKSLAALFTVSCHRACHSRNEGREQLRGHGRGSVSEPRGAARGNSSAPTLQRPDTQRGVPRHRPQEAEVLLAIVFAWLWRHLSPGAIVLQWFQHQNVSARRLGRVVQVTSDSRQPPALPG